MSSSREVTELLIDWKHGDARALERLAPLIVEDLRQMARFHMRREDSTRTLQPTALVNEVFLRLMKQTKSDWQNRDQFFGVATMLMRRILVEHARQRSSAKRGGGLVKVPLEEATWLPGSDRDFGLVALDEALSRLSELDARQAQVVELRFFMGLSQEEVAEVMGISLATVQREWQTARLWLLRELSKSKTEVREEGL